MSWKLSEGIELVHLQKHLIILSHCLHEETLKAMKLKACIIFIGRLTCQVPLL
jgi:hypothetical protein